MSQDRAATRPDRQGVPRAEPAVVITGGATPEETAVVLAVLSALGNGDGIRSAPRRSLWSARARAPRPRLTPGPGAWRGSALPR